MNREPDRSVYVIRKISDWLKSPFLSIVCCFQDEVSRFGVRPGTRQIKPFLIGRMYRSIGKRASITLPKSVIWKEAFCVRLSSVCNISSMSVS